MTKPATKPRRLGCNCGKVTFELQGKPIVSAACYCNSCRKAGRAFEAMPMAEPVVEADGGVRYDLQRKDRFQCLGGESELRETRLEPKSRTRRVFAACCNTPIFVEFNGGHWLSFYKNRIIDDQFPIELRTMIRDRPSGVEFEDSLPSYQSHSGKFMWKLLTAWIAMGFRSPAIDLGKARKSVH